MMITNSISRFLARLRGCHDDSSRSHQVVFPWRKQRGRKCKVVEPRPPSSPARGFFVVEDLPQPSIHRDSHASSAPQEVLIEVLAVAELTQSSNRRDSSAPITLRDILQLAENEETSEPPSTCSTPLESSAPREPLITTEGPSWPLSTYIRTKLFAIGGHTRPTHGRASATPAQEALTMRHYKTTSRPPPAHLTLFGLPAEIRIQIFDYVAGGQVLHIFNRHQRLRHIICPFDVSASFESIYSSCPAGYQRCPDCIYDHFDETASESNYQADPNILALLKTCRQAYVECINSLYTANIFDVRDPLTLMLFEKSVVPARLGDIRVLQLTWDTAYFPIDPDQSPLEHWLDAELFQEFEAPRQGVCVNSFSFWLWACKVILSKMSGLKILSIQLEFLQKRKFCRERGHLERILRPLRGCTGLQALEVVVTPGRGSYDAWGELGGLLKELRELTCQRRV